MEQIFIDYFHTFDYSFLDISLRFSNSFTTKFSHTKLSLIDDIRLN